MLNNALHDPSPAFLMALIEALTLKNVESRQKSPTYTCCGFLYTEITIWVLSRCQVPSDGVIKSEYLKTMCLSTSRLVIETQGMFSQLYIFVDRSCCSQTVSQVLDNSYGNSLGLH